MRGWFGWHLQVRSKPAASLSRRRWMGVMGSAFVSTLSLPAFPKIHDGGVEIQQHAAALPGFYSNAYLIEGAQSCALVDAHLNIDEARDLAALVATIRKPVTSIVITHPHPDHYLGLEHLGPVSGCRYKKFRAIPELYSHCCGRLERFQKSDAPFTHEADFAGRDDV